MTSTNNTTRVSSVSFQTSWLKVSSKIIDLPSSQRRSLVADADAELSGVLRDDQPQVAQDDRLVGAAVVEDVLAGERMEIIAVFMPGILRTAVRGHISTPSFASQP